MKDIKAQRLTHEARASWKQRCAFLETVGEELLDCYYAKHPEMMLYDICVADLVFKKEVRKIMCEPPDVIVGKERFLALEGEMEAILDR